MSQFLHFFFTIQFFSFFSSCNIPAHNLCLSVSRGCSGSHHSVIGMEDAVRHVGSPVWEECFVSGMSGVERMSRGRLKPQRLNPTSLLHVLLMWCLSSKYTGVHRPLDLFSLSLIFTCRLGVATSCLSAHMLPSALVCSYMLSFSLSY